MDENKEAINDASGRRLSAGEVGAAAAGHEAYAEPNPVEVIVGEIPDASDLTHMMWTARCTDADHGLLGTFETQDLAEDCRTQHLLERHA